MIEYLTNFFTQETNVIFVLAFFTTVIVLYAIFVFYFYKFLAKKNIIELNLNQYNQYSNPTLIKIFAGFFYVLEYIIILPVITFFWFTVLSMLLMIIVKGLTAKTILIISAALIASVRVTSYVSEDLSKDLAKMLPFTLLAVAITTPGFFVIEELISRISDIPSLLTNILYYLGFIMAIELIMRVGEFFQFIFTGESPEEEISETE